VREKSLCAEQEDKGKRFAVVSWRGGVNGKQEKQTSKMGESKRVHRFNAQHWVDYGDGGGGGGGGISCKTGGSCNRKFGLRGRVE
jgi:hypothetical protein